jgi:formate hydrogenlyase transcriptional activator
MTSVGQEVPPYQKGENAARGLDTIPTLAWSARSDGAAAFFNQRWLDYTGLTTEEARDWGWTVALHPEESSRLLDFWRSVVASGEPGEIEGHLRRFDGTYRWFLFRAAPSLDSNGRVIEWFGTNTDIDDRKHAECLLDGENRALEMAAKGSPLDSILETLCRVVEQTATGCCCSVMLIDPSGTKMQQIVAPNIPSSYSDRFVGKPVDREGSPCTKAVHRRIQVLVPDIALDEQWDVYGWRAIALDHGLRACWSTPIAASDGRVLGTFGIYWREPSTPTERHRRIIEQITHLAAVVIERKRAEEALRESEQNLRLMIDGIPGFVFTATPEGEIEFVNRQIIEYTGRTIEELKSWQVTDLVHPDDLPQVIEELRRSIETEQSQSVEHRVRGADGMYRWFDVRRVPARNIEGRIVRWYLLLTDIQERKRAEETLRSREQSLRLMVDSIPGFVVTLDAQGEVEVLNRQTLEYFGKSVEELKNWTTTDAVHRDDLHRVIDSWRHSVETGEPFVMESRQRRADGVYRWFQARALPTRDAEDRISGWYMLLTDIDDRKRAEEALRSREQSLRLMVDSIPGFIATLTADGQLEVVNRQSLEYFGKTVDELKNWSTADVVHHDDLKGVIEAVSGGVTTGEPFVYEHRARRADGVYRWHHARWHPQRDESGRIARWYGLVTDIDERKRAENALEKAYEEIRRLTERLRDENVLLLQQIDQSFMFEEIVGSSPALKGVLASIVQVAPTDSTVLISGETGTGKERIAHAIHNRSHRAGRAFVSVNCASIPPSLVASELFGHEKGAFTGAVQRRQGRFELADGGTIFLDEIGDLSAETQLALLRVLQERTFERVGGNRVIPTDVRIIAATNRDLTAAINSGAFRADLFYRLNVFPIYVPPLRERKEDIPILIEHFLKRYADKAGKRISKIDKKTLDLCASYDWPGNVRELQNIVERSVILCNGNTFRVEQAWLTTQSATPRPERGSLTKNLEDYERGIIEAALAESNGKVAGLDGAAAKLGIPRSTLDARIKQLHIKRHTVR